MYLYMYLDTDAIDRNISRHLVHCVFQRALPAMHDLLRMCWLRYAGEYFPLQFSDTYPARPGGSESKH